MSDSFEIEKLTSFSLSSCYYGQKKLIKLRREVNRLYFLQGISKNAIAAKKGVSKHFVIKWTQSPFQDFEEDQRGWPMGRPRKWSNQTKERIAGLHDQLKKDPKSFYWGPTAIQLAWQRNYPNEQAPPLRTIGKMLKDLGLSNDYGKHRVKGASRYLCYPEHTVYKKLGQRIMEADFVGQKYIRGRTEPLHFIGFSFKKHPKLRHFQRIGAATADNFINTCQDFIDRFEKPDCIKVDNAAVTIGTGSGKRNISRVMNFLLSNQIIPVFSVPRRPFTQASIEGNNSVFARKFWNQRAFTSVEDVDKQLEWFNTDSMQYSGYEPPSSKRRSSEEFVPRVYFLRQVRQMDEFTDHGYIDVLNELIYLPSAYINYFVLAEWDLAQERLFVYLEKDQELESIKNISFRINSSSKNNLRKTGALSSCM